MNDIPLDFDTLQPHGSFIGSAAVVVMSDQDRARDAALNMLRFFEDESCGQCTPCREGTGWLYRMLDRILSGEGSSSDLDRLHDVASKIGGTTICALGDAAAMPVLSFIKHFRDDFEFYVKTEDEKKVVAN